MYEGTLVWHEDEIAVRHFFKGELIFTKLKAGNFVELFQNGYWHKFKILSTKSEPYFENCNYGNCLGCEIRMEE